MSQITLKNEKLELVVNPEIGASIVAFRYNLDGQWVDIMRPTPQSAIDGKNSGDFSSFHLVPYSNRIENGSLRFQGKEYRLEVNNPDGHTIHGVGRDYPWKVENFGGEDLTVSFDSRDYDTVDWPFPFSSTMKFSLQDNVFALDIRVKNEGEGSMPVGFGSHPYFSRQLTEKDENFVVQLPLKGLYPGDTPIPTGPWVDLPAHLDYTSERTFDEGQFVDNCFRATTDSTVVKWPGSGVTMVMESDPIYENIIFYTPLEKPFFAIEPVTNCNNGFNMAEDGIEDTGSIFLEPGEETGGEIRTIIKEEKLK